MKTKYPPNKIKTLFTALGVLAAGSLCAQAQINQQYAARAGSLWTAPFYYISAAGHTTYQGSSGRSAQTGLVTASGCMYHSTSTLVTGQGFGVALQTDTTPGDGSTVAYLLEFTTPSRANNGSTDIIYNLSSANCVIQDPYGQNTVITTSSTNCRSAWYDGSGTEIRLAGDKWSRVAKLILNSGATHPDIKFIRPASGGGVDRRSYADTVRFRTWSDCLAVDVPGITPGNFGYSTTETAYTVTGLNPSATLVTIYQKVGSDPATVLGFNASPGGASSVTVPVSGQVVGATILAAQTVGGIESCLTWPGYIIGSGNSSLRVSLNMRNAPGVYSGPIGTGGSATSGTYGLFMMPNTTSGSGVPPAGGIVVNPSTCWQTITIDPRTAGRGQYWAGLTGTPTMEPWGAIDSFVMSYENGVGPFQIFIDNLYNGTTVIHDWEDTDTTLAGKGLFATHNLVGSTSDMLVPRPAPWWLGASDTANNWPTNQASSGTKGEFVQWEWNSAMNPGTWLRLHANAASNSWVSWPQVDMSKRIQFDMLLLPAGSTGPGVSLGTIGYVEDQALCSGNNFDITCPVTTTLSLNYQWKHAGTNYPGATTASLSLHPADSTHVGAWELVITDPASGCSVSRFMNLLVNPKVRVTVDPYQTLDNGDFTNNFYLGQATYLEAKADNSPCGYNVTYQWYRNGSLIPGASGSAIVNGENTYYYNIPSVTLADGGRYEIEVAAGETTVRSAAKWFIVTNATATVGSGTGLLGAYWSTSQLTNSSIYNGAPTATQTDANISTNNWVTGGPIPPLTTPDTNYFSIRWAGMLKAEYDSYYQFQGKADDGLSVWVNGVRVISAFPNSAVGNWWTVGNIIHLTPSTPVPIIIEYNELAGNASEEIKWISGANDWAAIPAAQLTPASSWSPTVALTPMNPPDYTPPASYTLTAGVTANGYTVTKVEFYQQVGTTYTLLGTDTSAPYEQAVSGLGEGVYTNFAKVYFTGGAGAVPFSYVKSADSRIAVVSAVQPATISTIVRNGANWDIAYSGGGGSLFTLMQSQDVTAPMTSWTSTGLTKTTGSGTFSIPVGSETVMFYRIKSE